MEECPVDAGHNLLRAFGGCRLLAAPSWFLRLRVTDAADLTFFLFASDGNLFFLHFQYLPGDIFLLAASGRR